MATTTILFTDIVSSSALLHRIGDEAGRRVLGGHYQRMSAVVEANGGEVVKWEGDGLMAAFLSVADAARASIAAQRLSDLPIEDQRLQIRAGLHVGETMTWEESDLFGSSVVLARRLCDAASAGQILCSALVVGLLTGRHDVDFREVDQLTL
jgi:class 3 adenylate cyclase